MSVDLDAYIGSVGLPVELGIGNVEKVSGTDNLLGRNRHQSDLSGIASKFGGPVTEKLFVCLDTFTFRCRRSPLKVHNALNLDGSFVKKVHPWCLIDGDLLSLGHTCDVLVIRRPFECRPLHLLLDGIAILIGAAGNVDGSKRTKRLARSNIPDNVVLAIVVRR